MAMLFCLSVAVEKKKRKKKQVTEGKADELWWIRCSVGVSRENQVFVCQIDFARWLHLLGI